MQDGRRHVTPPRWRPYVTRRMENGRLASRKTSVVNDGINVATRPSIYAFFMTLCHTVEDDVRVLYCLVIKGSIVGSQPIFKHRLGIGKEQLLTKLIFLLV